MLTTSTAQLKEREHEFRRTREAWFQLHPESKTVILESNIISNTDAKNVSNINNEKDNRINTTVTSPPSGKPAQQEIRAHGDNSKDNSAKSVNNRNVNASKTNVMVSLQSARDRARAYSQGIRSNNSGKNS
jgi:hypothetical protein